MKDIKDSYYNKYANQIITPESAEFDASKWYADLGELAGVMPVSDSSYIKINGKKYNHQNKDVSIGNNGHIKAPVFEVDELNHLLVANLYLAAEAKDGIAEVEYGNEMMKATLEGLDNGDVLSVKEIKGVNTQTDRKNQVSVSGSKITQVSNNGKHMIAVTLEADGAEIIDPSETVYALTTSGDLGITSPESTGNNGKFYTYGIYMKYKNGDYEAADIGTKTYTRKLIVPGKGSVTLTFTLKAEEYKA